MRNKSILLKIATFFLFLMLWNISGQHKLLGQQRLPFQTHTTEEQMVSLSSQTDFQDAINILSKVAIRDEGRAIVDMTKTTGPINVEVNSVYWKDALKRILLQKGLIYRENPNYYQIVYSEEQPMQEGPAPAEKEESEFTKDTREVKINAIFFQADRTKSQKVGIDWSVLQTAPGLTLRNLRLGLQSVSSQEVLEQAEDGTAVTGRQLLHNTTEPDGSIDVNAILSAFENMSLGKIISKPSIKVADGQKGYIQVGKRFAITQQDYAGNTVSRFVNAGTILEVTPQIISDSGETFIHLNVKAEKSSAQTGLARPEISTQEAETDVLLVDGEQTVIGGLFTQDKQNIRSGIPFLKDLPWWVLGIRYIAGSNDVTTTRKELIIFIKVELVKSLSDRIAEKRRQMQYKEQYRKALQDFDRNVNDLVDVKKQNNENRDYEAPETPTETKIEKSTEQKPAVPETVSPPPAREEKEVIQEKEPEPEIEKEEPAPARQKTQIEEAEKEIMDEKEVEEEQPQAEVVPEKETPQPDKVTEEKVEQVDTMEEAEPEKTDEVQPEPQQPVNEPQPAPEPEEDIKPVANQPEAETEKQSEEINKEGQFTVKIMVTENYEKALMEASRLTVKGVKNHIDSRTKNNKSYYTIKSGKFDNYDNAINYIEELREKLPDKKLEIYRIK